MTAREFLDLSLAAWDGDGGVAREFLESLARGQMLVRQGQGIKFVVCPFGGGDASTYYTRGADGKMRRITELELKEFKGLLSASQPAQLQKLKAYQAYMTNNGDGQHKFKILQKDKQSLGYVCAQTATLKVGALRDMIDDLNPMLVKRAQERRDKLPDKSGLCMLYELALRMHGTFARPHHANLAIGQLKPQKALRV
jgi:hypothetical protein